MEDGNPPSFIIILGLVLAHGLLALAYGALTNIRVNAVKELSEGGHRRATRIIEMAHENPNFNISYQLATSLLKFGIAAVAIHEFVLPLATAYPASEAIIYTLVLLIMVCVTLILGEVVPESIGSAHPHPLALAFANLMYVVMRLLSPLTVLVLTVSKAFSSVFSSSELVNLITEEEIVTMIESGGTIEEEEKEMILSVLQLNHTRVSEVMVPRIDIAALDIDTPLDEARARFIETGFSRIPLYEETVDAIKGLLYAKDLLTLWHNGGAALTTLRALMRPVYFVPEAKPVDELLKELQSKRVHMAIVVDEYGGTAGLVTIENIIEEIIGDIQDEYDLNEEDEYVRLSDTEYVVDASIDLDDFNDLVKVELPTEDSNTLGGFIYRYFGRVPSLGEEIRFDDELLMRVETVEGRRIRKVRVCLLAEQAQPTLSEAHIDEVSRDTADGSTSSIQRDKAEQPTFDDKTARVNHNTTDRARITAQERGRRSGASITQNDASASGHRRQKANAQAFIEGEAG